MIKKRNSLWMQLLSIIILFFALNVHVLANTNGKDFKDIERTKYQFQIEYDNDKAMIKGDLIVTIPNHSIQKLHEVFFHLYPNAFSNWKWEEENRPRTNGWLDINSVKLNEQDLSYHQAGTVLKVDLVSPLAPKANIRLDIAFTLKIPESGLRLTHDKHTVFLAQWYPMLAVHDDNGWHLDPYTTTGDPFFTAVADYEVEIIVPKDYMVASTAVDKTGKESVNKQHFKLSQENVRDFALLLTKEYQKITGYTKDDTKVNLYYLLKNQEVAGLLLGSAIEAMEFFNQSFGKYPMKEIDIVLTDGSYKVLGMEYPGIVTSVAEVKKNNSENLPAYNVVAHELAHQWWYGVVGNDQVKEPWLDEGLTSFSEYLFMKEKMGTKNMKEKMIRVKEYTDIVAKSEKVDVLQSIYHYKEDFYGIFVYARPAAMLWELKEQYGEEKILEILQAYYEKYKFKIAKTEDFKEVVTEILEKDMTDFFDDWLISN